MPEGGTPYTSPYGGTASASDPFGAGVGGAVKRNDFNKKLECLAKGGQWDEVTQKCILPSENPNINVFNPITDKIRADKEAATLKPELQQPEVFKDVNSGQPSGITLPDGRTFIGIKPQQVQQLADTEKKKQLPEGTSPVGTAQAQLEAGLQGQQLQGQVGQFGQLPVSPTGLDYEQAITQGIVGAIPRALGLAVAGAGAGLTTGGVVGSVVPGAGTAAGAVAGGIIGAAGGFVSGIASSMISDFRGQRRDTVNAQKRVLDEGKQTMKDWATLAEADPANKARYLAEYNKVAAQIDQAYRQMKLDTDNDLAKFEAAIPDLAEFEAFYSAGGERDALDQEMRQALLTPGSAEYKMLELAQRRLNG